MPSQTVVKSFQDIVVGPAQLPTGWDLKAIVNDDNITFLASHAETREALWVDPMLDDWEVLVRESKALREYRFVAVIDTHTHADHLSCAGRLADELSAPLVMHFRAPTAGVDLRVSNDTLISTAAGPLRLLMTPGHTWDGLTPIWGPFIFVGDTIMHGDTGRDDLPTGNAAEHFASLQKIKAAVAGSQIVLPGHDSRGGRASSWTYQLEINPSLSQSESDFVREASAYLGPAPRNLKESLVHNFK